MALSTYPSLPGLSWPLVRSPVWKTGIQPMVSGRELRVSYMSYPLYKWSATYDVLRTAAAFLEFQQLIGFFNLMGGSFQSFVFADPDDNTVSGTPLLFGTGSGARTFTLTKTYGGFTEPCPYIVSGTEAIYVAGVLQGSGAYTLNSPAPGQITFVGVPSGLLTWTGQYKYVCRFLSDTYDFDRFMSNMYSMKKIEWQSIKP